MNKLIKEFKTEWNKESFHNWLRGWIIICLFLFPSIMIGLDFFTFIDGMVKKYDGVFVQDINDNVIVGLAVSIFGFIPLLVLFWLSFKIPDLIMYKLGWWNDFRTYGNKKKPNSTLVMECRDD